MLELVEARSMKEFARREGGRRQLRAPHDQPNHARAGYRCRHPGRDAAVRGDAVRAGGGEAVAMRGGRGGFN